MKFKDLQKSEDPGTGWSNKEFDSIYSEVKKTDHSLDDIKELSKEIVEKTGSKRTPHGVAMAMVRMSMMIHGTIPAGVTTKSAETWFKSPGTIAKYLNSKGHDVEVQVKRARTELNKRIATEKKKVKRQPAKEMMFDYYKKHKSELPENIVSHRETIIDDIMKGVSVEDAFSKHT